MYVPFCTTLASGYSANLKSDNTVSELLATFPFEHEASPAASTTDANIYNSSEYFMLVVFSIFLRYVIANILSLSVFFDITSSKITKKYKTNPPAYAKLTPCET